MSGEFTHLDPEGGARMVDVGGKPSGHRRALAEARVRLSPEAFRRLQEGGLEKGDALAAARIAGIQAAKRTGDLIPLCHPIPLQHAAVDLAFETEEPVLVVRASVAAHWVTGVEMEAMTAASVAALTIYDMCKALDRGITIEAVRLLRKSGGRSGDYRRGPQPAC